MFSFANKYLHLDSVVVVFHDDDPRVLKEIKSYLEGNGYETRLRWAIINLLPRMSNELQGKMVSFYLFLLKVLLIQNIHCPYLMLVIL
jgi:hypothetical protein